MTESATLDPPATADAEESPDQEPDAGQEALVGQLAFDGFPIRKHTVKVAGISFQISDEEVADYPLGSELEFVFTGRVVKRGGHLLTETDGTHGVDQDIIVHMRDCRRKGQRKRKDDEA